MIRKQTTSWLVPLVIAMAGAVSAQVTASWTVGGHGDPWAAVAERWIALDDTSTAGAVQPLEIPPGRSVTRQLLRTGVAATQRNLFGYRWSLHKGPRQIEADTLEVGWHPRIWRSGGANAFADEVMRGLVDGDALTAGYTLKARADGRPNSIQFITLDLGVPVPIDSVVFFPPQSGLTSDGQRQRELFAKAYEVSRTATPLDWLIFEDETASTGSAGYHALEEILGSTFANNTGVVSLKSNLRFTRFLRFKFGEVTTTTLVAEIEAFGHGYPQEARYISRVHAFGEAVSLGRISWAFHRYRQAPNGVVYPDSTAPVRLELQTRAGFDDEPKTYFIFDELGNLLEVDADTYFDSPRIVERFSEGVAGFRAMRADDTEHWNNWSVSYQNSGDEIRSSDGAGFLQFRFNIVTEDPLAFGVLDSVAFEVSPLLADSALGEVSVDGHPAEALGTAIEVPLGAKRVFVYDIRTVAGSGGRAGFDGIELDVPATWRLMDVEADGVPLAEGSEFSADASSGRLRLSFAKVFKEDARFRIRCEGAIYQTSVFVEGRIFNHDVSVAPLAQSIEAGDARKDVASDGIQVIAGDSRFQVLSALELSTPVVTPNGDGINDLLLIGFDLFGIDGGKATVEVCDLAGRRIATLLDDRVVAGPYDPVWDGTDGNGRLVPPGMYVIRVDVDVDDGDLTRVGAVGVAY